MTHDCRFCQHGEALNDTANSNFSITINQDGEDSCIEIEYDDSYCSDNDGAFINYCPKCGRELKIGNVYPMDLDRKVS
ncbi:hypothetical protein IGI80_001852 [Enterococcus sp. DIV1420a]